MEGRLCELREEEALYSEQCQVWVKYRDSDSSPAADDTCPNSCHSHRSSHSYHRSARPARRSLICTSNKTLISLLNSVSCAESNKANRCTQISLNSWRVFPLHHSTLNTTVQLSSAATVSPLSVCDSCCKSIAKQGEGICTSLISSKCAGRAILGY